MSLPQGIKFIDLLNYKVFSSCFNIEAISKIPTGLFYFVFVHSYSAHKPAQIPVGYLPFSCQEVAELLTSKSASSE
jgi:hypothetical protein